MSMLMTTMRMLMQLETVVDAAVPFEVTVMAHSSTIGRFLQYPEDGKLHVCEFPS